MGGNYQNNHEKIQALLINGLHLLKLGCCAGSVALQNILHIHKIDSVDISKKVNGDEQTIEKSLI